MLKENYKIDRIIYHVTDCTFDKTTSATYIVVKEMKKKNKFVENTMFYFVYNDVNNVLRFALLNSIFWLRSFNLRTHTPMNKN